MNQEYTSKYLNTYGVRFTKKQKHTFQNEILSDFEKLGYKGEVIKSRKGITNVENIHIGNIKQAKTLVLVPYDTPSKIFWPENKFYPLDGIENNRKMFIPVYMPILIGYVLLLAVCYGLPQLIGNSFNNIISVIAFFLLAGLFIMIFRGFENKNNAIRNSSSIVMALDIAEKLKDDKKREVAFVFTDKNKRFSGNDFVNDYLNENKKSINVIALHCIGRGKDIRINSDKASKGISKDLLKLYKGDSNLYIKNIGPEDKDNTCIQNINRAILISSGTKENDLLLVEGTAKNSDTLIDDVLINGIEEMLVSYFNKK